ncbi:MAG: phosphatase PAP2 family protein, partial [Acidimicrobiales bacterium]
VLHRPDAAEDAAIVVTTTATGLFAYPLAGLAGWGAVTNRRRWVGSLAAVSALAMIQFIRIALAVAIGRARPPIADWAWHAGGPAMPSGHATTSAFVAVLITYGCGRRWPQHRGAIGVACAVWAVAVGVSRVYLGVHWPTDVVAGWLLAVVLAAVMSVALNTAARRSASTHVDGARTDVR